MQGEPRTVTTCCPRCGKPIVWSARPVPKGYSMEVVAYGCYCLLSDEEWDDLSDEVIDVLEEREG